MNHFLSHLTCGFVLCHALLFNMLQTATSASPSDSQTAEKTGPPSNMKGHLQPFGMSGTNKEIEVRTEFPEPYDFLVDYVQNLKPLKLAGVARDSRAVRQWTDDYLMTLDVPSGSVIGLETKKKENRSQETTEMHFHDFLKIYNQTEHYMVDDVPLYLRPDLTVPCSLQCPELMEEGLAFAMMWFSSGGTKSVVHTDSFDNINCVLRGEKTFVMVDPARDREKIQLRTEGAYSDIDVDSVDLTVYPSLADTEYYHINVTAGDCLYIPYKWIHQVRSFNSNIAVNYWWNHYSSVNLLRNEGSVCQGRCDPKLSLDQLTLHGQDPTLEDSDSIRDWFKDLLLNKPLSVDMVMDMMKMEFGIDDLPEVAEKLILELFEKLDLNEDGLVTIEEHKHILEETWEEIERDMEALTVILENDENDQKREYAEHVAEDRRKDEL